MASNFEAAIIDHEHSILRAIHMCSLQELADKIDQEGKHDSAEFAYLLRCVWVAAHKDRVDQLSAIVGMTVDGWIQESDHE